MKKIIKYFLILIWLIFMVYLLLPSPELPPLPDSLLSDEAGDTVEIANVSAYFTDIPRSDVIKFYQQEFSRSGFLNLSLPVIVLNHPPEYSREVIRKTTQSTFLYELVHPFKDSLFVNGWDPKEDPQVEAQPQENEAGQHLWQSRTNRYYERKIILRHFGSGVLIRLFVFTTAYWLIIVLAGKAGRIIISTIKQLK